MQKDFMSMAQGAGASQQVTEQDLKMTDADYEEAGLPGGEGPEAMKQRILTMLEQAGVMEGLEAAEQQEIIQLVDQLIVDVEAQNFEAVEQNPIMQLLSGLFEQMGVEETGQQAAPADMAAMAGPGGMPGGGGGMPPMPGGGM